MSRGFWAGDAIAQSLESATKAQIDLAQTERIGRRIAQLEKELDSVAMSNAANLAEKQALRVALAKLDPNHPLLSNKILQEKIKEAGKRALAMTNNFDDAREAGGTFRY